MITYTGTSYLSSDQAIREAELYYTQLEANLQERINNMESENRDMRNTDITSDLLSMIRLS